MKAFLLRGAKTFFPVTYSKLTHKLTRGGREFKPSGPSSAKGTQNEERCREVLTAVGRGRARPFIKAVDCQTFFLCTPEASDILVSYVYAVFRQWTFNGLRVMGYIQKICVYV